MAGAPPTSGDWVSWATQVLNGIGAPVNQTNYNTLWLWTQKEGTSAKYNYLATTQNAPGATAFNTFGNNNHVWNYPTVAIGAAATAQTLQNGLYGNVLTMLKNTVPANQWTAAARTDLNKWGGSASYSNFLGGSATAPTAQGPTNPTIPNPTDALTTALGGISTTFQKSLYYVAGVILILGGVALLAALLLKGAAPAVGSVAANFTPAGRAIKATGALKPKAKAPTAPKPEPLSPEAQASVAAAKAGRGSKLSPAVKAEMRRRAA